jgi:hypothetical protein
MNISEKVIDIVKGMEGIGGMPTDEEFLNEFEFRLQSLKQGQTLPLDNVSVSSFVKNAPSKIYLNLGFNKDDIELADIDFSELSNLSWCDERINDADIEYSR